MKRHCAVLCYVLALGAAFSLSFAAENLPPAEGGTLPAISLPVPTDTGQQTYLGLVEKKSFTIADIAAEVVIIEIFSMY